MKRVSNPAPVLREVAWHAQPHALARPRAQSAPAGHPAAEAAPQPAPEQALLEQARREAYAAGLAAGRQGVLEQVRHEAVQAGLQQGREAGLQDYRAKLALLEQMMRELAAELPRRLASGEDDMVELVYACVCRIMGQLALTPAGVRTLLAQSLAQLHGATALGVRLHAQDLAALRADPEAAQLLASLGGAVRWQPDNSVRLGGCVLDGASGSLDARLETQLQALRATLLAVRAGQEAGA